MKDYSIKRKQWYQENKERIKSKQKERYQENKSEIKEKHKEYYEKNKEELKSKQKEYNSKNYVKGSKNEYFKEYRENNKTILLEKAKERNKQKRKTDPLFKIKSNMRSNIANAVKRINHKKESKTELILGCSFDELKQYLESKFEVWMNWGNYGLYNGEPNFGWDIDHKIPQNKALNYEELIKLNHYTNLQPLCSKMNRDIKKGF